MWAKVTLCERLFLVCVKYVWLEALALFAEAMFGTQSASLSPWCEDASDWEAEIKQ